MTTIQGAVSKRPTGESKPFVRLVPYFCQWESATLALDIVEGRKTPADDPFWRLSGALTQDEYVKWANHACGMACLKMVLAARTGKVVPTLELLRRGLPYGTYTESEGAVVGLIYAPFVTYVREVFGIEAEVATNLSAADIPAIMEDHAFFIASVHPWIRWPERAPPKKGGHLVLVTAVTGGGLSFHNPSGHEPRAQANAEVSLRDFNRFFAGRGIIVRHENKAGA